MDSGTGDEIEEGGRGRSRNLSALLLAGGPVTINDVQVSFLEEAAVTEDTDLPEP